MLLGRPHASKIETVNDKDAFVANFWRAVTLAPDEVARWCDWPVNEVDLHARHLWLVSNDKFRARMESDPDYFDSKVAGWWVWGISQWIGGGWCRTGDPSKKIPILGNGGRGVVSQLPELQGNGKGVTLEDGRDRRERWFRALQERLRRVRVCCGDWRRVLGDSVIGTTRTRESGMNPCAVFLDPPYSDADRESRIYGVDDGEVSRAVAAWARERGGDPDLRIALCGYEGEHEMPGEWACHAWSATGGYAGTKNENKRRERIWFSPHCLSIDEPQGNLFGG